MSTGQQAGTILADAFLHYPLMTYAFEGHSEEERLKRLNHLYTRCTNAAGQYGGIITTDDNQGALIWLAGKNFQLTLWKEIRVGMGAIPFLLGPKATLRLMTHDAVPEGWIRQNANDKMGYIWCVGVAAHARGKGYSRRLIEDSITQMRAQGMDNFWLKTDDAYNVPIYLSLGFELMYETVVKSSGVPTWVFKKL